MELSKRLQAVAGLVTPGNVVCDVGCDHGYVSVFLAETGRSPKVYAMDVRKGPLSRAAEHVKEAGLENYIELLLSDGIKELPEGAADTLVCAGMGGRLVIKILSDSLKKVRRMKELVLQPQSEIWLVRIFLREQGFVIADEDMVEEEGKFYPVLYVKVCQEGDGKESGADGESAAKCAGKVCGAQETVRTESFRQKAADKYGQVLLEKRHPVLKQYLLWEEKLFSQIEKELENGGKDSEKTRERKRSLAEEKELLKAAFAYFESE